MLQSVAEWPGLCHEGGTGPTTPLAERSSPCDRKVLRRRLDIRTTGRGHTHGHLLEVGATALPLARQSLVLPFDHRSPRSIVLTTRSAGDATNP
jgi:hypothetical protein